MDRHAKRGIALYGLSCTIVFLYVHMLLFVSVHEPNFGEEAFSERGPYLWRQVGKYLEPGLIGTALPAWVLTLRINEPYYRELVYYPLLGGVVWFGYGSLIAWGRATKRVGKVLACLAALWTLFLYVARFWKIPMMF